MVNNKRLFSEPNQQKRHFSAPNNKKLLKPAFTGISINIEGFSKTKADLLSNLCQQTRCHVLCVQETHRDLAATRPQIPGMSLIAEIPDPKHGSAIFARPDLFIESASTILSPNHTEILSIDIGSCSITSVYSPPGETFDFKCTPEFTKHNAKIVLGDFNSHSTTWGYTGTDDSGESVEAWAEANDLELIHNPKLPASFNSGRWKRGYNPDLIFASPDIASNTVKSTCKPIPRSQHRPIMCTVQAVIKPNVVPLQRRFNFKKADWDQYAAKVDEQLQDLPSIPENYDKFVEVIRVVSRQCIPRGCSTAYIPGLDHNSAKLLDQYASSFSKDPFSTTTSSLGEEVITHIAKNRQDNWIQLVESVDMAHNSKKAWGTLRKLTSDPPAALQPGPVTANQVAHQLLLNGKSTHKISLPKPPSNPAIDSCQPISKRFTLADIKTCIKQLKNGKATGIDDMSVEQLKHLGKKATAWLLAMFNTCITSSKIPKMWRKSKITALLKPGKSPDDPKHFRPIALLCHTYKLFERMLLNRLTSLIDPQLIPEQAGFRPGKSCSAQVLNLTQHIEDGYERGLVTGVAFIDLSAAYDTVNINLLLKKVFILTKDQLFVKVLGEMLRNRRFQVLLHKHKSRWRNQKNGLPQGSVLAPILFNIYTNDQPHHPLTHRFIYADDLALTSQAKTFVEVEANLSDSLQNLTQYYKINSLKPNPSKTESCAFHLRNQEANRVLKIMWDGVEIKHNPTPKYLGVTLDRSLTYRENCLKLKSKVSSRNNILRRLTSTRWGASPKVLRTSSLALCYSAGEYACPVWARSAHAKEVDVALNASCRIITGTLKPTPLPHIYSLAGIAPPSVRREIACSVEKHKQMRDSRHPLYNLSPPPSRLGSRHSFLRQPSLSERLAPKARLELWKKKFPPASHLSPLSEKLPPGGDLPWTVWKSLNRLRTGVGRCHENRVKWGFSENGNCECGAIQNMKHILQCPNCPMSCTVEDLWKANNNAIEVAKFWSGHI